MNNIQFLIKFWGMFFVVLPAIYLFQRKTFNELLKSFESQSFILMSGFVSFILGTMTLAIVSTFELNIRGVIFLVGLLSTTKGIWRITNTLSVHKSTDFFKIHTTYTRLMLFLAIIFGIWLLSQGLF